MRFELHVRMGNSAFEDETQLARILQNQLPKKVLNAVRQYNEGDTLNAEGIVKDDNGNTVGKWKIHEPTPATITHG